MFEEVVGFWHKYLINVIAYIAPNIGEHIFIPTRDSTPVKATFNMQRLFECGILPI